MSDVKQASEILTGVVERPSGTVTFLFTDVEGSTASWEQRPEAMRAALALHDDLVRSTIVSHDGHIFSTGGDGFAAVFARAESAVQAAIDLQVALAAAPWPDDLGLSVRVGLHSGEAHERGGDYFGPAVNRAARVMDAANGVQILASASTREVMTGAREDLWRWIDLGVHELRDVLDPVRLYRVESSRFESDPRPPRSGNVRAGNLPAVAAPLLGRGEDIESISAELGSARVVTLTGVGGIGKTRLAVEIGRQLQTAHSDGVWLAALDTIDRPDALVPTLLGLFGIETRTAGDVAALIDALRFRDALLILDNCEHLLDAVADVAMAIASSCPKMRLLATSREPLDIDGELVRRVRSLSVDEDGSATALFRLRAEEAGATVDGGRDADAILQICRRLDGIPLAIELAAARTRSLRPAEIAARLDDMFRLLTGGKRASAERHRTLRATLEWSYDMLSDVEQLVLARLSVFAGTFALEAADHITGSGDVGSGEIVDVLDRLVVRSLVVPVDGEDETRLRLLEPVRQLAAEKLAARGETDSTRDRHTSWYLAVAELLGARWRAGEDQAAWPAAARELPNLIAAFEALVDQGRVDDAQRFAVTTFGVIDCQFDNIVSYAWAPASVGADPAHVGGDTASACGLAAWGMSARGQLEQSATWLRRGLAAIDRGSRDDGLLTAAAVFHAWSGGERVVPDAFLERSLQDALASDDLHRQIWVLSYAGRAAEVLERAQRLGNRTLIALAYSGLTGDDAASRWDAAETFWEAAQRSHSHVLVSHAAHRLGVEHIRGGAPVEGLLVLRAPLRDWLLRADRRVWDVLHAVAWGIAAVGDLPGAARLLGAIGGRARPLHGEHRQLEALLDAGLEPGERARLEAAGAILDAGEAVAEALARIDALVQSGEPAGDADLLTTRQHEIAALVARGLTNKQIAQRLGISRYTAETHVRNILERLGAASRAEIATWYAAQPATGSGMPVST